MIDDDIIRCCKDHINHNNVTGLMEYYRSLEGQEHDWQRIFLKVYLHACLKKRKEIVEWLLQVYETFDPISKIALRQTFAYGRHLLNKPEHSPS
jgi:hypothetical protein